MVKGVRKKPGQIDPPAKKPMRPPDESGDRRTERIAIRAHPDLVTALNFLARDEGLVRSVLIERILISYINAQATQPVLDNIGRALPDPEDLPPAPATGLAPLRSHWARNVPVSQQAGFRPEPGRNRTRK